MLKNGYSAPIIFRVSQDFGVGDVNGAINFVLLSNVKLIIMIEYIYSLLVKQDRLRVTGTFFLFET